MNWLFRGLGSILTLLLVGLTVSCASTDNPYDNWVLMSEGMEKSLGSSSASKLEKQVGLYESEPLARYISNVGSRVAVYSDRNDLDYKFRVLDIFPLNALALPGGYIYVTRGLLRAIETEAELAGVLAHEIAHVAAYHSVKRKQWSTLTTLSAAAVATQTGGRGLGESLMAQQTMIKAYTRSSETQADRLGLHYMAKAGYSPKGLVSFLSTLQQKSNEVQHRELLFMRTHPFVTDRIRRARKQIQGMGVGGDTTIVGKFDYQRQKGKYLFQPREKAFLQTYRRFFEAYRNQNLEAMRALISPDFQLGSKDSSDTVADFLNTARRRIRVNRKIEYDNRLMKLDVGDTSATVVYEYTSRRWPKEGHEPEVSDGLQKMVWRQEETSWRLIRLL